MSNRISNKEQGISNDEVGAPSSFEIPCSLFRARYSIRNLPYLPHFII